MAEQQLGTIHRENKIRVKHELQSLEININSEIATFLLNFRVGNFHSDVSKEELNDIESPTPQIRETSEWLWADYDIDSKFIALTSFESEGGYLYDRSCGEVIEFEFPSKEINRWKSYFEFISWYLMNGLGHR